MGKKRLCNAENQENGSADTLVAQNIPISRTRHRLQNWAYYTSVPSRKIMTQKRTTRLIHNSHHNSETENKLPIIIYDCQFTVSQNSFCMVLAKISFSSMSSYHTLALTSFKIPGPYKCSVYSTECSCEGIFQMRQPDVYCCRYILSFYSKMSAPGTIYLL
jgi:hypothetical protein